MFNISTSIRWNKPRKLSLISSRATGDGVIHGSGKLLSNEISIPFLNCCRCCSCKRSDWGESRWVILWSSENDLFLTRLKVLCLLPRFNLKDRRWISANWTASIPYPIILPFRNLSLSFANLHLTNCNFCLFINCLISNLGPFFAHQVLAKKKLTQTCPRGSARQIHKASSIVSFWVHNNLILATHPA